MHSGRQAQAYTRLSRKTNDHFSPPVPSPAFFLLFPSVKSLRPYGLSSLPRELRCVTSLSRPILVPFFPSSRLNTKTRLSKQTTSSTSEVSNSFLNFTKKQTPCWSARFDSLLNPDTPKRVTSARSSTSTPGSKRNSSFLSCLTCNIHDDALERIAFIDRV